MTPQRWRQLKELYDAEDTDAAQRDMMLAAAHPELAELYRRMKEAGTTAGFLEGTLPIPDDEATETVGWELSEQHALSPGDHLCGRFEVIRFIARGGMGEVYEAYDSGLREAVALKTVRASSADSVRASEAFRREVRRARAISSPHVCRVHDLFIHEPGPNEPALLFLSMRLLRGETLAARMHRDGPLKPEEALPLLRHIAAGLDAAHAEGIVHGDLKSGNIIITRESGGLFACITDFGLARRIAHAADETETNTENQPRGGTPAWMAPEQVEGHPSGREADIYSFGLIAYDMVTGRLPFDGGTPDELMRRRLTDDPYPARRFAPDLAPVWDAAFRRCLDRDSGERFPSASAFLEAIDSGRVRRSWRGWRKALIVAALGLGLAAGFALSPAGTWVANRIHPIANDQSIAVLPFQKLGSTPDYFSDGFTEELIHALSQLKSVRVLGPESSFYFRSSTLLPGEIGRKLGVSYLLTGSVSRLDREIRVIVRLIRTSDGSQIWSREMTRNEQQVLLLRDDIARMVARDLGIHFDGPGPQQAIDRVGLSARDLYWTGRLYFRQRTDQGIRTALDYFRQAIARDPSFALGYCGLADTLFVVAERALLPPDNAMAEASTAAHKAVQLDSHLPEGWVSLAQVTSIYEHNLDEAERLFRHALTLDPKSAAAWQWYSYQLVKQRRFAESVRAGEQAVASDPLSLPANVNLAVVYLYAGYDDRAVQQSRKISQMDADLFFMHPMIALVFGRKGLTSEAVHEMESVPEQRRDDPVTLRVWVEVYAAAGMRQEASRALATLLARYRAGGVPVSYVAAAYAAMGDKDHAFEWMERALNEHDAFASVANAYPAFDSIRQDARYAPLMAKLGIKAGTAPGSSPIR